MSEHQNVSLKASPGETPAPLPTMTAARRVQQPPLSSPGSNQPGSRRPYEEAQGRSCPCLTVELGANRSIVLPYMSLIKAVQRNGEILIEFGAAQVHISPGPKFNTADFLVGIGEMKISRLSAVSDQCEISVLIDPMEPKEEGL